jgi:hypothetical protein
MTELVHFYLVLRRRVSAFSKDGQHSRRSWFETRYALLTMRA